MVLRKQHHISIWGAQEIISDNGSHFKGEVWRVMKEYIIEHHKSSPYRPQADGAIEATNKNVKNILAKMVVLYKDWAEMLPFALWVIELLSVRRLGQHLTLWFMLVRRCFLLRWRYNL